MLRLRVLGVAALALCLAPAASAQLNLTLINSFVDNAAGGNGNIGVTQDEVVSNFYVIDFSNTLTVHEYDPTGTTLLNQYATVNCVPSALSPNDIVWDPDTDTLWMVDNNGNIVLNMSRAGACIGGFSLISSPSNPVGITYNRVSKTLFVSSTATVQEYDKLGNLLTGGFAFTPPAGGTILAGITWVPSTGNYLIVNGANNVFEVSPTGALVSTTSLSSFGVINAQGVHYNVANGTLVVADNSLSTIFVFSMGCIPAIPYGSGCAGSGGFVPKLGMSGCPIAGQSVTLDISNALGGALSLTLIAANSASVPVGGGCTLLVQTPPSVPIFIPLGGTGPGAGMVSLGALIPATTPLVTIYLQTFVGDTAGPIGLTVTNGLKVQIQ